MERVVTLPFDEEMHTMPWRAFLHMLIEDYAAAGFVCGEDFRFGYRGEGNADALEGFCREQGLAGAVVKDRMIDGIRVSSTYIRRQIETGDMELSLIHILPPTPCSRPASRFPAKLTTRAICSGCTCWRFTRWAAAR